MKWWLALGVACGWACGVSAAQAPLDLVDQGAPNFQVFTAKDGLSEEIWSTVGFDAEGFVWVGSASGLARFDGYRFAPYALPEARSLVRDMEASADGRLWAVFEREGLAEYHQGEWRLTGLNAFAQRFSAQPSPDGEAELYLAQGAEVLRHVQGAWQPLEHAGPRLPGLTVKLARTRQLFGEPRLWNMRTDGSLWFRTESAGPVQAWQRFEVPLLQGALLTDLIATAHRGEEELWVLSYGGGVLQIDAQGVRLWPVGADGLPSSAVYSAVTTHDGAGSRRLWLATRGGLVLIDDQRLRVFDRRHGLPSNAVRGIKRQRTPDGEDVLWLPTEGGIARVRLSDSAWQTVSLIGASENGVFGTLVEPDADGGERLWVGSAREGLNLFERGQWQRFEAADLGLESLSVRGIWRLPGLDVAGDRHARLLGVSGGELFRIDSGPRFTRLNTPWAKSPGEAVTSAHARRTDAGVEWWLGLMQGGAWRLRGGRWTQVIKPETDTHLQVLGIAQHGSGAQSILWFATPHGLLRWNDERLEPMSVAEPGLAEVGFRSVAVFEINGEAQLWAGSIRNGVLRWALQADGTPRRLPDTDIPEPPDPTVYSVQRDSQGRMYVCTNNGVQQLTPLPAGGFSERVFRRRDGLVHDECNSNGQLIDSRDRYWVGTLGGLSVYDPAREAAPVTRAPRPLRIVHISVDGDTLPLRPGQAVEVPAGSRELKIGYVLLSGDRESESMYRTRLSPYEDLFTDWGSQPARSFGALPPGEYVLEVEARDFSGTPGLPLRHLLQVAPWWWQHAWAQWLMGGGLMLLALGAARLYSRRVHLRQRELELEVAHRTIELRAANEQLMELSTTDALTQLPNRRCLMQVFGEALERARVQGRMLGVILIDVDHFKRYNDSHGHLAGDAALRAVGQALDTARRTRDLVARYGGEEFVCLLEDASVDTVAQVAERMRARVAGLTPREIGNEAEGLTLSAGYLARVPSEQDTADSLLADADKALYAAKHSGRDCAVLCVG